MMIKRLFDIVISILVLLFLIPLFALVAISILFTDRGPIFYTQQRLGKHGSVFLLYKFRSMSVDSGRKVQQTDGSSDGVTRIGRLIRRVKIDELPQLINVLIGDMSIVGPRPCLPELFDSLNEDGHKRFLVNPGLTGLAQVNGNIYLSWEDRWKLDREYVENKSILLDFKIMLKTIYIVLVGEKKGLKL